MDEPLFKSQRARRRTAKEKFSRKFWLIPLGLISVFAIVIPACSSYFETHERTTVVTRHERVCDASGSGSSRTIECKYLVFTKSGTFELTDSLVIGRFDSSDIYGQIVDGHQYKIQYYGWRFGCSSSYPNIKNMTDLTDPVGGLHG